MLVTGVYPVLHPPLLVTDTIAGTAIAAAGVRRAVRVVVGLALGDLVSVVREAQVTKGRSRKRESECVCVCVIKKDSCRQIVTVSQSDWTN